MQILIANDDGIYSPGIAALARVASRFGEVRVVAPDVEQSSMGHAITHARPLTYRRTPLLHPIDAYRVNGTPADCVALGTFLWEGVDLVLSGINLGPNIGHGIWHSGTLAAAKQAALLGLRGIAFSTPTGRSEPAWDELEPWVAQVIEMLLEQPMLRLVNVNLPPSPSGICWTRVSVRHYDGIVTPIADPYGREMHWLTVQPIEETEQGTDRWAVQHGHVSVTPLRVDLTDHELLDRAARSHPLDQPHGDAIPAPDAAVEAAEQEEEASEASVG